jgi:hypothetical protein
MEQSLAGSIRYASSTLLPNEMETRSQLNLTHIAIGLQFTTAFLHIASSFPGKQLMDNELIPHLSCDTG